MIRWIIQLFCWHETTNKWTRPATRTDGGERTWHCMKCGKTWVQRQLLIPRFPRDSFAAKVQKIRDTMAAPACARDAFACPCDACDKARYIVREEVVKAWRVEHGGRSNPPPEDLGLRKPPPPKMSQWALPPIDGKLLDLIDNYAHAYYDAIRGSTGLVAAMEKKAALIYGIHNATRGPTDDEVRAGIRMLKARFTGYQSPPLDLPADSVIEDVVRKIMARCAADSPGEPQP